MFNIMSQFNVGAYLPALIFGMKKEPHMYSFRTIINWDNIKNDNNKDTSNII